MCGVVTQMDDQKKRKRDLPEGYECHACGSTDHPIYDCALYKNRKQNKPKKIKLFTWGLLNSSTAEAVSAFLSDHGISNPLVKLVMNDNGNGCRGVGFITVDEAEKDNVIALNGENIGTVKFNVKINTKDPKKKGRNKRCYRCGGKHDPSTCTNPRICYRCKSSDHVSTQCPLKSNKQNK